jgi:protein TonB
MRELLPPANWSPRAHNSGDAAIALNTRDPQYITYFTSIKRNIEFVWEYPEPALRYGLQGKLLLQFTILASGELESAQIIRSSGSNLLDHEALRAMKAAAPFRPIPPWIDKKKLTITASFEYLDNRLNYRVAP